MSRRVAYALGWLAGSALLLSVGFLATVCAAWVFAGANDPHAGRLRVALVVYAQVVLLKGLLPQLAIALALWPLLDRAFALRRRGRGAIALGLVAAAALAGLAVAALLLPARFWGLAGVSYTGAANFLRTWLEMTSATALALAIPRLLVPPGADGSPAAAPRALGPLLGLAAAALVAFLLLARDPGPAAPAPGERLPPPLAAGAAPAPAGEPTPERSADPDAAAEWPATTLPLHLLQTQVEALPSQSFAIVLDRDARVTETLHEGESFARHPQAQLERVEVERVLIDNDGRLEQLRAEPPEQILDALVSPGGPSPETRERMRRLTETLRARLAAEREGGESAAGEVRGGLLAEGDPRPVYRDGALIGFELADLRPGGAFERIGLRDGDLVDAVNGVPVQDLSGAEILRQVATTEVFELSVDRPDGSRVSVTLPTIELLETLRATEPGP